MFSLVPSTVSDLPSTAVSVFSTTTLSAGQVSSCPTLELVARVALGSYCRPPDSTLLMLLSGSESDCKQIDTGSLLAGSREYDFKWKWDCEGSFKASRFLQHPVSFMQWHLCHSTHGNGATLTVRRPTLPCSIPHGALVASPMPRRSPWRRPILSQHSSPAPPSRRANRVPPTMLVAASSFDSPPPLSRTHQLCLHHRRGAAPSLAAVSHISCYALPRQHARCPSCPDRSKSTHSSAANHPDPVVLQ